MKLAKVLAGAAVAVLLGVGLVAGGGQAASAGGRSPGHAPVVCKMANGGLGAIDTTGLCPQIDPRTGAPVVSWDASLYRYYNDISPYVPIADPTKFPLSDGGLNCNLENDGTLRCQRWVPSTATAGRDGCTLDQVSDPRSFACRGSVVQAILDRDENTAARGSNMCTPETIYYGKGSSGQPRYWSSAIQCYDGAGLPTVPYVEWHKYDGKGPAHAGTVLGVTTGYLKSGSAADTLSEPAGAVTTSSTLTPGQMTAPGDRADYTVTVRSSTAGSAVVVLHVSGLTAGIEDVVPASWIRVSSLSKEYVTYLVPHLSAGEVATASLHFTVTSLRQAFVSVDTNGATASSTVDIRPAAPLCTSPDAAGSASASGAIAVAGTQPTILVGVLCSVQPGTTLTAWKGTDRGAGTFTVDGGSIRYVPASPDFRGSDTIYVYTSNEIGVASLPTAVHVNVVDRAAPVNDEYTVKMETRLTVDAAHGLMANDTFPGGADGWSVVSNGIEADGAIHIGEHGELTVEPGRHFTGDLTFEYKLGAPGQGTDPATVTIHVVG
ncbi:hypothetical protein B7R21_00955 [Subtercola boreus]|uniref:Ig-like domain-containing protein n=1 Tax=Subtercola boreus TaxID=120213 RepID=A0A3E0W6D1_9MICO|nr:hypothetical protein [Subtercola boreus]RFA17335.1 hypothetical protein B7R21_00955 [Subtercola boreus]